MNEKYNKICESCGKIMEKRYGESQNYYWNARKYCDRLCDPTLFKKGMIPWNKGKPMPETIKIPLRQGYKNWMNNGGQVWNKDMKGLILDPNYKEHLAVGHGWNKGIPMSEEQKKKLSIAKTAEKNHNWKGGGWAYFHRNAKKYMEEKLGRKLLRTEVVHHKDFDHRNNDPSNLEVMSRSEHNKIHKVGHGKEVIKDVNKR